MTGGGKVVIKDKAMCDVCWDERHKALRRSMTRRALQSEVQAAIKKVKSHRSFDREIIEGTNERPRMKVDKNVFTFNLF